MLTHSSTRDRHGRLRTRLTDRDRAVLQSLYQLRLLTSRQIQRLHVPDGAPVTRSRRTRALLQRLTELGAVVRLERNVGGMQPGSSAQVFGLSGRGLGALEVSGPYGRRRRTVWETKPYFMQHVLSVAEVCVGLTELARTGTADLLAFDGEPVAWRRFTGGMGAAVTLKPDAYIRVGIGDFERSVFLELDMGSESLPTIERKCQRYVAYWRSAIEQREHGVFPLVLWLVPTEDRQGRVQAVIQHLPQEARPLFAIALQSDGPAVLAAPVEAVA